MKRYIKTPLTFTLTPISSTCACVLMYTSHLFLTNSFVYLSTFTFPLFSFILMYIFSCACASRQTSPFMLVPLVFFTVVGNLYDNVWFSCRESSSSCMAQYHSLLWASNIASSKHFGSPSRVNNTFSLSRNRQGALLCFRGYLLASVVG